MGFLNANKAPLRSHEDILVFYQKRGIYLPQMASGKGYTATRKTVGTNYYQPKQPTKSTISNGLRFPKTVLNFSTDQNTFHPTQKPVALFEYLVRTYTNEGMTVLDNTCGSGTTGIACKRSGRNFIQMDLSEEYCNIARQRYEENIWKVPYKLPDSRKRLL